ncbi:hypothetical protein [Agromyces marinus]|uniref:NTP pyrophosphohydrolase n=1 Tax=Agromyces marinus TaxID=1389020 RepID=A0ABN6YA22_9MICO|nr:hypothetical protein [Agromyces marinus]UIP57793.1 hypothetical protein DSM26151_06590 [Agromyces marinus]BDZ54026.1 hypothetical protein GCM10025870_10990 [Agromyces marinus]
MPPSPAPRLVVVVDVANVMGSRPDGWWRDRAGAATRLLERMPRLAGRTVAGPDGEEVVIDRIVAVLEGAAKAAVDPVPADGLEVVRAPADGDGSIVEAAADLAAAGDRALVVTADRGLRARLPGAVGAAGQGWFNALIGR